MAQTQENFYYSVATPLGADALLLKTFHGDERISGLFHFTLDMESEDPELDFSGIVGKSATITVDLADGSKRFINGIVGRFLQAGSDPVFSRYRAELHPWLWLLTMSADCRIFQNQSVPDIIEAVFSDHGLTDFDNRLMGSYQPREYCVQYNESAFDFVSRLMEDEGIFYFFEHEDGKHTMVLADDSSAFITCPGAATLQYGTWGQWTQQNVVTHCTLEECVIAGAAALDDFNFETPSTDLVASVDSTVAVDGAARRIYEYPGGFLKKDPGESRAGLRIEEHELPAKRLVGRSYCRAFVSGTKFALEDHYREDANDTYVLSRLSHAGTLEGYSNSFEAFPADVPYRPPRTSRKPTIPGTQTAIVVGKSGEEIWCDKYGRVKVQFHWDQLGKKDENSSCWIRVAHGWAGKSWGMVAVPRIGQEVVVSFLEGDPDRPLITGSVYNAEQTVPYALPGNQTRSTWKSDTSKGGGGYNELRFEDKKDSEEVYLQAEKDMNRVVKNNDTLTVGLEKKDAGDQTIEIHNHRTVTLNEGNDTLTVAKGNRTVKVDTGNELHEVEGNFTLKIKGDMLFDVTGKVTVKAGSSVSQEAGTTFDNKAGTALTNESGTDLTNKAGTNLTNEAGLVMENKASTSQTVDGGGMLTVKGGMVKIN